MDIVLTVAYTATTRHNAVDLKKNDTTKLERKTDNNQHCKIFGISSSLYYLWE